MGALGPYTGLDPACYPQADGSMKTVGVRIPQSGVTITTITVGNPDQFGGTSTLDVPGQQALSVPVSSGQLGRFKRPLGRSVENFINANYIHCPTSSPPTTPSSGANIWSANPQLSWGFRDGVDVPGVCLDDPLERTDPTITTPAAIANTSPQEMLEADFSSFLFCRLAFASSCDLAFASSSDLILSNTI
jgi:hypothetical protein